MAHMIPIDLDINMLRCFKKVAETGSFTKAGNNIGLTQAGVSTNICRLEERLDAKIFDSINGKMGMRLCLSGPAATGINFKRLPGKVPATREKREMPLSGGCDVQC